MPISVVCPSCNSKMTAPDKAAGRRTKCPTCSESLVVPTTGKRAPRTAPQAVVKQAPRRGILKDVIAATVILGGCALAIGWVGVAYFKPFAPDPVTVKARFRANLTALSPNWDEPLWETCEPRGGDHSLAPYCVRVRYHDRGHAYACTAIGHGDDSYCVNFARPLSPTKDFAQVQFEGGKVRKVGTTYQQPSAVIDWSLGDTAGRKDGVVGPEEASLLESLATDLAAALREAVR